MTSSSVLTEDRFSILLSRLDRIEASLAGLEDVKKLLVEIEDNTHAEVDNKCDFRQNKLEKVIVAIRTSIISVGDIDTVGQQFKCDFYMSATWSEPQLQGRSPDDIRWSNEWHPRIVFFNAVEIEKMEINHKLFYEEGNKIPYAMQSYRIKGSFRENLELWNFPLDYQQLTITLMSDWTDKLVEFEKDLRKPDTLRPETFTADQEWHLCRNVVTESTSTVSSEGSSANDYPLYHIKCHVKRKNGYYLWNIVMIIFLISLLSFCSFSVEISSPSDRLSVTLTLLLTAVAFKFVVSQSLPTISYLTLLDKYVLCGLLFLGCMAIENAVAAALILDSAAQKKFDRICLYVGIGCFVCIHVVFFAFVIVKSRTRNRILSENDKKFREMLQRVKNYAMKQEQRKTEEPEAKDTERSQQDKVLVVKASPHQGGVTA